MLLILEILCPGWMVPVTGFNLHHTSLKTAHGAKSYEPRGLSDIMWLGSKFWGSRGRHGSPPHRAGTRQRANFKQREHPVESEKAVTVQTVKTEQAEQAVLAYLA